MELFSLPRHVIPASMVIYGYPKSKERYQSTPRPDINSSIFMNDSYKERTFEDLEEEYKGHGEYNRKHKRTPLNGEGTVADEYYGRKYTSSFMAEMNRSALYYIERYLKRE